MTYRVLPLLFVVGCGTDVPDPLPDAMTPDHGYNGVETQVTISGRYFYPQVGIDAATGNPDPNNTFEAWLETDDVSTRLSNVALVDFATLSAVVPDGLSRGSYDLRVEGPTGADGVLPAAFEVTDTEAHHLAITVEDAVSYLVGETATVVVQLQDRNNGPVFEALDVIVTATVAEGLLNATFGADALGPDQEALVVGTGISGSLRPNGSARIPLRVDSPAFVTVTVSPDNSRSGISADGLQLEWDAGTATGLSIDLLVNPLVVVAGDSFPVTLRLVDDNGFTQVDAVESVVIKEDSACGNTFTSTFTEVAGTATMDVTLLRASGGACPTTRLKSVGNPPGVSAPIKVIAAPIDHFEVVTTGLEVVAGDPIGATISPVDRYGNTVPGTGGVTVTDSLGSLAPGDVGCLGMGPFLCTALPTTAAPSVRLLADSADGTHGESEPYAVLPDAPVRLVVEVVGPITAGEVADVGVAAEDAYGNRVDASVWDPASLVFRDDSGDLVCPEFGTDADGLVRFDCTLFEATPSDEIVVSSSLLALSGASDPFAVVNGALAAVEVTPGASDVAAGEPMALSFAAFDAFGNPYLVQADATLVVADSSGTLDVASVTLDGAGTAVATAMFQRAGSTVVTASQDALVLGASSPIAVHAGPAASLGVALDAPWAFVGSPLGVTVTALDAFANPALLDATATVQSASSGFADVAVAVVGGQGTASVTFTAPRSNDQLTALAGALAGASGRIVAVTDCGVAGPVANVAFGLSSDAIVCRNVQGEATIAASFAGSTGSPTLFGVLVDDGVSGVVFADAVPLVSVTTTREGRFPVTALVADAAGCGSEVAATAWVGDDDGTATGPLVVSPDVGSVALGGTVMVTVSGATDCAGDPAVAPLLARSNRGVITDARATGAGLEVDPDADGDALFTLSASATTGGTATIQVGTASGSASGTAFVPITGDDRRPIVWSQTPSGDTAGFVDQVELRFSEPLLDTSVTPSTFTIGGPGSVSVADAVLVGDTVTLVLDGPIDAAAGLWTVTAVSSAGPAVRDLAGNKLDGAYNGTVSSYVGAFGALPSAAPAVLGCAVDLPVIHPDGDDGPGAEADFVHVALDAEGQPEWWVISVETSAGTVVRRDYVSAIAAQETWTWDARDGSEKVVDPGVWRLVVETDDGQGNRGGTCASSVTLTGAP